MTKFIPVLMAVLLFSCQKKETQEDEALPSSNEVKSENQIIVSTTTVEDDIFHKQIIANGIIEARHRSEMRFRQTDNIQKIYAKNGDIVKQGALIAKLDQTNIANLYEQAKREFEAASTRLLEEKANYGIVKKADSLIQPHILTVIKNRSGYNEAEARLANKEIMLEQTEIRAPFYGRIANLNTKEGNFISSADIFCTLISHNELDVIFHVLESELQYLRLHQQVKLHPFGNATKKYQGKIIEINPLVEENGLIRIKAKIDQPSLDLFDGMNMKVIIEEEVKEVISIPKEALVLRSNREVVFSLENAHSKWNYVDVVDENTQFYAIKEGVKIGDTIVISNNMNLAHDAKVKANFIPPVKDSIQ